MESWRAGRAGKALIELEMLESSCLNAKQKSSAFFGVKQKSFLTQLKSSEFLKVNQKINKNSKNNRKYEFSPYFRKKSISFEHFFEIFVYLEKFRFFYFEFSFHGL